jgi:hypothetical protein
MKVIFGTLGLALLAVAYYLWTYPQNSVDSVLFGIAIMIAVICFGIVLWPRMRSKSIACCSASIAQSLIDVGVEPDRIVCPIEGSLNYKFLMEHIKDYKFVIYDANPLEDGEMALKDIQLASDAAKAGAHVIVRLDRTSFGNTGLVDRRDATEMLLQANQLQVMNTTQLQTLILKYYAKKG